MAQRLKRWESPRQEGRNEKGRGGSARQRQKQKQMKALKQKLQQQNDGSQPEGNNKKREETILFLPSSFKKQVLMPAPASLMG